MGWKPRHLHPRSMAASSLVAEQSSLIRGAAFCRIFQVDSILQRFELVATVESSPRREQVTVSTDVRGRHRALWNTPVLARRWVSSASGPRVRCKAEGRFSFHSVCRVTVSASSFRISFSFLTVLRVLLLRASAGCFSSLVLPKERRQTVGSTLGQQLSVALP
ncbi:hypothetical protein BJX62DRAFT_88467 [Aspergillus germanicus]